VEVMFGLRRELTGMSRERPELSGGPASFAARGLPYENWGKALGWALRVNLNDKRSPVVRAA
jgi:hypothetical protein